MESPTVAGFARFAVESMNDGFCGRTIPTYLKKGGFVKGDRQSADRQDPGFHVRGQPFPAHNDLLPSERHLVRPARDVDLDRLSLLVHGMELEFSFPILRVEEDDAVTIETVAGSVHGHLVAEAIVKLAGVFGSSGFTVLTSFERFPNPASQNRLLSGTTSP